jgi:hypothetical protein
MPAHPASSSPGTAVASLQQIRSGLPDFRQRHSQEVRYPATLPCTTFYRFDSKKGPQEGVLSFHCLPRQRKVVDQTTLAIVPARTINDLPSLTEYQFAGDPEAHEVPR